MGNMRKHLKRCPTVLMTSAFVFYPVHGNETRKYAGGITAMQLLKTLQNKIAMPFYGADVTW